jgi:DNA-binding CsgD family transcriptional regulator
MALGNLGHVALSQQDDTLAAQRFAESLDTIRVVGSPRIVHGAVAGLAGVAQERGESKRAARLLGAVEAARQSTGGVRIAYAWQAERIVTLTRATLGEAEFQAAWNAGQKISFDEALEDALALVTEPETEQPSAPVVDLSRLTVRQREVLGLLVAGSTDREIASALFLSVRTVEHHVANILAKLNVQSRSAAATAARDAGLRSPESHPRS